MKTKKYTMKTKVPSTRTRAKAVVKTGGKLRSAARKVVKTGKGGYK